MRKFLSYLSFVVAGVSVVYLFVTATNYIQLAAAIILYPLVAYFALQVFPRKTRQIPTVAPTIAQPVQTAQPAQVMVVQESIDLDKRAFLKFVGATSLFFLVSSFLGKWLGNVPFGRALQSGVANSQTNDNPPTVSAGQAATPTSGYTISEIDDGIITYYGFINKNEGWLIMREDTDTSSFRYAKGDLNFPGNWANRANLKYDYYYNLL